MEPFYGEEIDAAAQQKLIEQMLAQHRGKEATEELKKEIYQELREHGEEGLHLARRAISCSNDSKI